MKCACESREVPDEVHVVRETYGSFHSYQECRGSAGVFPRGKEPIRNIRNKPGAPKPDADMVACACGRIRACLNTWKRDKRIRSESEASTHSPDYCCTGDGTHMNDKLIAQATKPDGGVASMNGHAVVVSVGPFWWNGNASAHSQANGPLVQGAAGMTHVPQSQIEAEQRAYRAGWEAGARKAQPREWVERNGDHYRVKPEAQPIDLQRMSYESRASSDRAASREHAAREPWHAGLDPDEP